MTEGQVCLTLILSRQLRDELFDFLGEQTDLVLGFTASDAAGHGPGLQLPTPAERVKGHADQIVVWTVLSGTDAARLIDRLRSAFSGTGVVYWIVPVTEIGTID